MADFEAAWAEWKAAFARVPDAALTYLKPGDDYALGGLQIHVNWVLAHYRRILLGIIANGFGELGPQDPPGAEEQAKEAARRGISASERWKSVEAMKLAHLRVQSAVLELSPADWSRKARVVYGVGQDPFPTSPEDIVGWLCEHYREHVEQCAELIEEWRGATAGG